MIRPLVPAAVCLGTVAVLSHPMAVGLPVGRAHEPSTVASGQAADLFEALGLHVTGGAAPGYVEDEACRTCHRARFDLYQQVGMARSFARPQTEPPIEDFSNARVVHASSRQTFEMRRTDDGLLFRRFQVGPDGEPINVFEQPVAWVLGSGRTSRTYLYETPGGERYQLPIAWYTQERQWGMAPGFDRPDHLGVTRIVRRECLFCHNAYPDVPEGSDVDASAHVYPKDLPEGIGCQRCHGPGAEHTRLAHLGRSDAEIRASIVNPGKLPADRRNDVCYGCHLQPAVALAGVRRFERADYSFRPGESLRDYLVLIDVTEEGQAPGDRFEINHHAYRLQQSACAKAIESRLGCLTCHDPHRQVASAEREEHYRDACRLCHEPEACTRPWSGATEEARRPQGDCVTCHMPRRRTQDVVHVVMTDHRIQRPAAGRDPMAPLAEREPVLTDARLYQPEKGPAGSEAELYRALAVARTRASAPAADRVEQLLAANPHASLTPYLDLIHARLALGQLDAAGRAVGVLLERFPGEPHAIEEAGLTAAALGRWSDAATLLRRTVDANPDRPDLRQALGRVLLAQGSANEALIHLERSVALRPTFAIAWYLIGAAHASLGELTAATDAWRRALEISPSHADSYVALARALVSLGRVGEARRYLRHGLTVADRPEPIAAALASLP